jgi:hypothetical protein
MIKINTTRQLEKFLKVLAEESVSLAKTDLQNPARDERHRQSDMIKAISRGKKELSEEDPEKTAPEPVPAEPKPAPAPEPAADDSGPAASLPTPSDLTINDINPDVGSLIDAIKDIRGGKGSGDSMIEPQLRAYFDRLDEAEKAALIVMMRSIGEIMRQTSTGDKAKEPEQYGIITTVEPGKAADSAGSKPAPAAAPAAAPAGSSEENTAPPIAVNRSGNVSEAYRTRIKDLLRRN